MSKRPQASPALPSLAKKRRAQQNKEEKVVLERVLGLTCVSSCGLAACGVNGCIAYPAGFITVLYLPKKNRQLHILNTSRKPISCLCLSPDGRFLATGESGHQPCVRVWDISTSPAQVAELKGHTHGISCVAFSPNLKYLVSVGYQHDMNINVWSWKSGISVASNKTTKVFDLAFSDSGNYFVTVGSRRVRFWYLDIAKDGRLSRTSPLKGRSAVLGDLQDNCFVGVSCGRGPLSNNTYALTQTGLLCLFDVSRRLDKFTEVKASPACCLAVSEQYLFSGCSDGVVRIFDPYTLDYLSTLPRPHSLGVNIAAALDASQFSSNGEKYPDTTAIAMDDVNKRLTVVYNDHSLYIWDVRNVRQIGKTNSFLYHSACIWDVCTYPCLEDKSKGLLPEGCFVTSSSDNTIRFWCLDSSQEASGFIRNIYSKELMKIIYAEPDVSTLMDLSEKPGDASVVADMSRGVRSIQFHPEGQHLAMGDRAGNLRVYDLQFMDKIFEVEAHDSEVLCIEYSQAYDDLQFLATSSRDRLMHVFTVNDGYHHLQTIDDHSASITSIKFTAKDSVNVQLLSCGADKSIMFRALEKNADPSFHVSNHIVGKATIYDMDIDAVGKHMVTAGQDKMLRIYSIATGKQKSVVKPPAGEDGSFIKVTLDPSGLYAAASGADKAISLFDFYSGECLARLYGHSEVVTQMRFSKDCKRLYSVSGDSCIFVWRLSRELTQTMHDRLAEIGRPVSPSAQLTPTKPPQDSRRDTYSVPHPLAKRRGRGTHQTDSGDGEDDVDSGVDSASFRLSVSQLPSWAQKQVMTRPSIAGNIGARALERATEVGGQSRAPHVPAVGGRWAQRVAEVQFASEGQEAGVVGSDTEKEEAVPKAVEKQDLAVIDLTEDDEDNGNEDDSRVTVRGEEYLEEVVEDCEEEIIYPTVREGAADVDPSAFHVTTPVKRSRSETDGAEEQKTDDSDATPENSPAVEKKERFEFHIQEEEEEGSFLQANFVTLSAEKVEQFLSSQPFDPHNPRLSISARFFSGKKDKSQVLGLPSIAYVDASPKLETYTPQEDSKKEGTDSDPSPAKSGSKPAQSDSSSLSQSTCSSQVELPQSSGDSKKPQEEEEEVCHGQTSEHSSVSVAEKGKSRKQKKKSKTSGVSNSASADDYYKESEKIQSDIPRSKSEVLISTTLGEQPQEQHQETQHQSAKASKRRGSIEEEISKTKKRLEELGYSISGKDSEAKHAAAAPVVPAASHKTVRVKPRKSQEKTLESAEATESAEMPSKPPSGSELEDPSELLLSRVNFHIERVSEHFKAITELHDEAVQGLTQEGNQSRADCEDTITTVATAVNLLKSQVSTMANKHRRMWRGKDRSSGYSLRATPVSTPEREPYVDTPRTHPSLSSSLATKVTAVSKLAEVALTDSEGSESLKAVSDPDKSETTEGGAAAAAPTPKEECLSSSNSATTSNTSTVSVSTDETASDEATQDLQDILKYSEQLVQLIKQKMAFTRP